MNDVWDEGDGGLVIKTLAIDLDSFDQCFK